MKSNERKKLILEYIERDTDRGRKRERKRRREREIDTAQMVFGYTHLL